LTTPKTTNNVPIHLPSNQSVGEGGTKEEKIWIWRRALKNSRECQTDFTYDRGLTLVYALTCVQFHVVILRPGVCATTRREGTGYTAAGHSRCTGEKLITSTPRFVRLKCGLCFCETEGPVGLIRITSALAWSLKVLDANRSNSLANLCQIGLYII